MTELPERPRMARRARLRWDATRESHVLLLPERIVMLAASAAEILELCDGRRTHEDIVGELQARYPDADLAGDVTDFLREAWDRQWLEAPHNP